MRKVLLLFLLLMSACPPAAVLPGDGADVLLQEVAQDLDNQRFEAAMEKGLRALELARGSGDRLCEVQALQALVGIDIMASRDETAWEKALEAEAIAREKGFKKELSGILISKAKLCSYAEISPETGRNDEGLTYAREALTLAEEAGAAEQQCEACYVIGSLYINKNRWSDPIDEDLSTAPPGSGWRGGRPSPTPATCPGCGATASCSAPAGSSRAAVMKRRSAISSRSCLP